jgi:hypothetical protein
MLVTVRILAGKTSKTIVVDVDQWTSVLAVRLHVCEKEDIRPAECRFVFAGKWLLVEELTLADYSVMQESVLHLAPFRRGSETC